MEAQKYDPIAYLRRYFGYDSFKKGQASLVDAILAGKDVLGVMPTGAGKSVCYQLPAAMLPGVTLVISPLISLMKDQVDALEEAGIPTVSINSTLTSKELDRRLSDIARGRYKIVYVAPERLESERFMRLVESIHIPLVAVDEAHCVSQWGHDFRPSYMNIARLLGHIHPRPVLAAFTATATDQVKQDIVTYLKLAAPMRVTTGYARDNLSFQVVKGADKRAFIAEYVRRESKAGRAGIIYASTRKEVEDTQRYLAKLGIRAGRYHAGLSDEERSENQERFLYDELQVMVATNAFGMGIDKSNVRYVIHYNLPRNLESYYQEAGRAGRDGEPGECVLLFAPQDIMTQKFLIEQGEADAERKKHEYDSLSDMVDYCHTTECLQRYIIRYFGDKEAEACGRCGNCLDDREMVDITTEALKIFSCVARMRQRFGVTLTAKVLRGSGDAKLKELGFDLLPTYGAMNTYKEKDIVGLIQALAADGYLKVAGNPYPILTLTQKAKSVLDGEERVYHKALPVKSDKVTAAIGGNPELFEKLRELRKTFAERQKVPPFTIFHDAALREMCEQMPLTQAEFLSVKGVGESKAKKYGDAFLSVIRSFASQ